MMPPITCRTTRRIGYLLLGVVFGCKPAASSLPARLTSAQFGIFFGGQIQQRLDLPLELDSTRQAQGFRLVFETPVQRPTTISWTLDYPTTAPGQRGPSRAPRAERTEQATLHVGADRFEQLLTWRPSDVPGTFNIRVRVEDEVVLDRPFRLLAKPSDSQD